MIPKKEPIDFKQCLLTIKNINTLNFQNNCSKLNLSSQKERSKNAQLKKINNFSRSRKA